MGLHARELHHSPLVAVRDMRCRPETLACSCEECSSRHVLVLPRRGAFVLHADGRRAVVDTNRATIFNAGQPRRVSHLDIGGDDCTALAFSDELIDEAAAGAGVAADRRQKRPFPALTAPLGPDTALKSQIFFADLNRGGASVLTVEERAVDLLRQVFAAIPRAANASSANPEAGRSRARHTAVAAQEWIAARPFENWSLGDLARDVGSSPYHLLRLFRAETGSTIHQYRMQLRLAAAARAILEGCDDLTVLALDLGFSSHSHFTDAFRRRFGMAPSSLRRHGSRAERARPRKNSTAGLRPIR